MNKQEIIGKYFEDTKNQPPAPLVEKAVQFLGRTGDALDLGCGAGRNTRLLVERGFHVTAVDRDPRTAEYLKDLPADKVQHVTNSFTDFIFGQYDLVVAIASLHFAGTAVPSMIEKIKSSLRPGGIFAGNLLGVNDDWRKSPTTKTAFYTRTEVEALFTDMELLQFTEKEYDGTIADGRPKHWHTFLVIARKK